MQTVTMNFRRHYIRQQGLHTPVVALFAAFFACSTKFARTASDERCEALSTRLRDGPCSSRIQLSLFPRWPRLPKKGSTGEGTTRVNSVAPVSYLRIRSGRLHGHGWTIQAPPPCKGPPPIFRAWTVSVHGRLPGTLRLYLQRINGDGRLLRSSQSSVVIALVAQLRWRSTAARAIISAHALRAPHVVECGSPQGHVIVRSIVTRQATAGARFMTQGRERGRGYRLLRQAKTPK